MRNTSFEDGRASFEQLIKATSAQLFSVAKPPEQPIKDEESGSKDGSDAKKEASEVAKKEEDAKKSK
jgi:hypothetical protein